MNAKALPLAVVLSVVGMASGHSALLWYADFETYASGAALITNNATGAIDTFSSKTGNFGGTAGSTSSPFGTGNYGHAESISAGGSMAVRRNGLAFGAGDVRILSMDIALASDSVGSLAFAPSFINASNQSISSGSFGSISLSDPNTPIRLTAVYNNGGSSLLLPGTMGSLESGSTAYYYKLDGAYTLVGTAAINPAQGDGAGLTFGWSAVALGDAAVFDNVGFWSSASDTVNGVNVLELGVGAIPVPEPSTVVLLVGSLGFGALVWSRRRRLARA